MLKMMPGLADPHVRELVEELTVTAGAAFSDRYRRVAAGAPRTGVERLRHPVVGELRLAYEALALADADEQRLVVHLPADDATATALDHLADRPSATDEAANTVVYLGSRRAPGSIGRTITVNGGA
jgi:hypothetical protein